jgi:hypothetical protein
MVAVVMMIIVEEIGRLCMKNEGTIYTRIVVQVLLSDTGTSRARRAVVGF